MQQRPRREGRISPAPPVRPSRARSNVLPMGITVAVLAVMALAIAIDASSVPGLAFLTIVLLTGLIGAIIIWG